MEVKNVKQNIVAMKKNTHLLEVGLYAMAKASEENRWFPGHIGASLLAIALFFEENREAINAELEATVLSKAEEIIQLNAVHYEAIYSEGEVSIEPIVAAVKVNIDKFSADGHGVIYGALALKAIATLQKNLRQEVIQGIAKIVLSAQDDNVARYWEIENYKETIINPADLIHFKTVDEAAHYCLTHQENMLGNVVIDGKKYYFEGSRLHEVTHAHALVLLNQLGYSQLAEDGMLGLSKQIFFNTHFPEDLEPEQIDFIFNPFEVKFWQFPIKDYHHYKLAYAVFSLCKQLQIQNTYEILKPMSLHWKIINS